MPLGAMSMWERRGGVGRRLVEEPPVNRKEQTKILEQRRP
jgi:hypothetical protein